MTTVLLSLTIAAALQAPAAGARQTADTADIARLETAWNESHVKGDGATLDRIWADDFVVTVPEMPAFNKADVIGVWRSGRIKFQRYDTSNVRIRVYGDSAVVTGRVQRVREVSGRVANDDWQFTKTYVRRDGRWQVVAFHASAYVPPPG